MGILAGVIMGFVYAATPGPVNVETLRRGVNGGFLDSLAIQAGTSVGRIFYALLALFGAGVLLQGATLQLALGVFGVTVLFYLGITAIRDGRTVFVTTNTSPPGAEPRMRAFWTGAILSLANPLAIVFWLSLGGRMIHDPTLDGPGFLTGFFAGCIAASLCVSVIASFWQSRLPSKMVLAISWTCGLVLIGFGLKLGQSILTTANIW